MVLNCVAKGRKITSHSFHIPPKLMAEWIFNLTPDVNEVSINKQFPLPQRCCHDEFGTNRKFSIT